MLTTDHGSVYVKDPVKILGDRTVNTNLRYKYGKSLKYNSKEVFEVRNPEDVFLPRINVSTAYVFARSSDFSLIPTIIIITLIITETPFSMAVSPCTK